MKLIDRKRKSIWIHDNLFKYHVISDNWHKLYKQTYIWLFLQICLYFRIGFVIWIVVRSIILINFSVKTNVIKGRMCTSGCSLPPIESKRDHTRPWKVFLKSKITMKNFLNVNHFEITFRSWWWAFVITFCPSVTPLTITMMECYLPRNY